MADDPFLLSLTEEERLHGLDLFGGEPSHDTRPPIDESETYERVPAYADRIEPSNRSLERTAPSMPPQARTAPPEQPETWTLQLWYAPLLAGALTAVLVVYAVMAVRVWRTTAEGELAALNERIVERYNAAHPVPHTAVVAAVPEPTAATVIASSGPGPAPDEPTPLRSPERGVDLSASNKVSEAPAHSTSPMVPEREVPPTAEPLPIPESTAAPLFAGVTVPPTPAVEPRPVVAVATPPRAEASAAPVPRLPAPAPEAAIQTVLGQYRTAYRELDAGAARAVWPSVDTKALRKAFDRLERQDLIFDSCQIAVSDVRAVASCRGFAWYVPRVGSKDPHDDQRQWEFKLSKVDDVWLIDAVSAR